MKKIFSLILIALMLVSLTSIVAFAAENVVYLSTSTGDNTNDGFSPETPKKSWEKLGGNGVMGLLENGGKLVVVGKSYLGGNYAIPRLRGPLTITSVHDGVDYKNPEPASNPACAFKMAGGAALTVQSDVTFDDIIIFQEGKQNNSIIVEDGGVLTVTESVICTTKVSGVYFNIIVKKGGTAVLNGGIYSSVTGDGEIVIGGNAKIHETVVVDPNAPVDGDITVVFHDSNSNDNNDGLTPTTPKKSLGNLTKGLIGMIPRGGTIVTVGKSYIGTNYAFPQTAGPVTFTSVYGGVDYKNPEPATNPTCAFKMASGATLTISSDLIFDDIILFQENNQNAIHVTAGATLVVNENVVFMTKPGNGYHFKIIVDEGCTAILSPAAIETFDIVGAGEIINSASGETVEVAEYVPVESGVTKVQLTIGSTVGYVNDRARTLDAAPIIRNSRTMLPVRFLANVFGVADEGISWNGETRTATLKNDTVTVVITIDSPTMTVNGETVALDSPAIIENDRTYLPVRAIANALGVKNDNIKWDGATSTAILIK